MSSSYYLKNKDKIIENEKIKYLKVKNNLDFKIKRNKISTEYYYKFRRKILEKKRRERKQTKFIKDYRILYFD
jgi:hypothetical protein